MRKRRILILFAMTLSVVIIVVIIINNRPPADPRTAALSAFETDRATFENIALFITENSNDLIIAGISNYRGHPIRFHYWERANPLAPRPSRSLDTSEIRAEVRLFFRRYGFSHIAHHERALTSANTDPTERTIRFITHRIDYRGREGTRWGVMYSSHNRQPISEGVFREFENLDDNWFFFEEVLFDSVIAQG